MNEQVIPGNIIDLLSKSNWNIDDYYDKKILLINKVSNNEYSRRKIVNLKNKSREQILIEIKSVLD